MDNLKYEDYMEKKKLLEEAEIVFHKEEEKWLDKILPIAKFFEESRFSFTVDKNENYIVKRNCYEFYYGMYKNENELVVESDYVSLYGYDCDNDLIGFLKLKMEDVFRDDYKDYFTNLYEEIEQKEHMLKELEEEKAERELYERLKTKFEKK